MSNLPTSPFVAKTGDDVARELIEHVVAGVVAIDHEKIEYDGLGPYTLACGTPDITNGALIDISRMWGQKDGSFKEFIENTDYTVDLTDNQFTFESGQDPDSDTYFYVSYRYDQQRVSGITDVSTGSVTRTLLDAVARQVAAAYQSLTIVKAAAYIESAEGDDLDRLLELVGMTRNEATQATGYATLYRDVPTGEYTVPLGTQLAAETVNGQVVYETTNAATFYDGYTSVRVPIQAIAAHAGLGGNMASGLIKTILSSVQASRVSNPAYYTDYESVELLSGNYGYTLDFQPRRLIGQSFFGYNGTDKGFIAVMAASS